MHSVDLTPLYTTLNEGFGLFLTGLVGWLGMEARGWLREHAAFLGASTDKALADGFERALQNGAQIAQHEIDQYEGEHSTVAVNGWLASKAAQYAVDHSPDYMKRFGLSPDDVARKALAYLPPPPPVVSATPSPAHQTPEQERAETAALNNAEANQ